MARGDHIFVNRFNGIYNHHGIDCGDDTVIHYTSFRVMERRRIERTPLARFAQGDRVEVRDYSDFRRTLDSVPAVDQMLQEAQRRFAQLLDRLRGIELNELDFSPDAVVRRAESRLGESRFDLMFNNCEHFAAWCKTGLSSSKQIEAIWRASMSQPRFMMRRASSVMTRLLD